MPRIKDYLLALVPLMFIIHMVYPEQINAAPSVPGSNGVVTMPFSPLPEAKITNMPTEVPMPMMQFPPLADYQFIPAQNLEMKNVKGLVDGSRMYQQHCSDCHGQLLTTHTRGASFAQYTSAVKRKPTMKKAVAPLAAGEVQAILDALR